MIVVTFREPLACYLGNGWWMRLSINSETREKGFTNELSEAWQWLEVTGVEGKKCGDIMDV